jgi:hypothetical protein
VSKNQSAQSRRNGDPETIDSSVRNMIEFAEFVTKGIGERAFILITEFPFVYIGTIMDVVNDYVLVDVDTAEQAIFEDRIWAIHLEAIRVIYYEMEGFPRIPELKD